MVDQSPAQKALVKLGLTRPIDLALHLPLRYEDETRITPLRNTREGDMVQIEATVTASEVQLPRASGWVPAVEPIPWSRVGVTPPAALAAAAADAASPAAASHTGIDRSRGLVAGMVLVVIAVLAGSVVVGHRRKRIGS